MDCVIISQPNPLEIQFAVFQYNGSYYHGHTQSCPKINKLSPEQKIENTQLVYSTRQKEYNLQVYLEHIKLFYENLNITMHYTIETEWECSLPKHKSLYRNIQERVKTCNYLTFLNDIKQNKIKGNYENSKRLLNNKICVTFFRVLGGKRFMLKKILLPRIVWFLHR